MPLGSAWWAANGAAARWAPDFSTPTLTGPYTLTGCSYAGFAFGRFPRCYQAPLVSMRETQEPGDDTGIFYLVDGSGNTRYAAVISVNGTPTGNPAQATDRPQWRELRGTAATPECIIGDVEPHLNLAPTVAGYLRTPWIIDNPYGGGGYPTREALMLWFPKIAATYDLYHYQPWAWYGSVAEVIASMVMQAGLASTWIDTASFDTAYDGFVNDAPWVGVYVPAVTAPPTLYVARKIGQTIAQTVLDVARHSRDVVTINMAGKLALLSRTRPPTLAGLSVADGIKAVEWEWTMDHLFNTVSGHTGHGVRTWGDHTASPESGSFGASNEPNLESVKSWKWRYSTSSALSVTRYGGRDVAGQEVTMFVSDQPVKRRALLFPYFLDQAWAQAVLNYIASDGLLIRRFAVTQDLRGLDYDNGYNITSATLTGDGLTTTRVRCIEKTVDFRNLTVKSTLLQLT